MSVSVGVACAYGAKGSCSEDQLYQTADAAMYKAKKAGEDSVILDCCSGEAES